MYLQHYSPQAIDVVFNKRPEGHTPYYRSFVNKYLGNKNPDRNNRALELGKGEFSCHTEISFQKHLDRLKTNIPLNTNPSKQPGRLVNDREALRGL